MKKIINYIRPKYLILLGYLGSKLGSRVGKRHVYKNYNKYIEFQKEKSTDPEKVKKWLNEEWLIKLNGFNEIFERNHMWLKGKKNALCLGSRTGQEVKALMDMGINSIGIDIVPFPPYTVEGDIHNLDYKSAEFDLIFTNVFDHSLHPEVFCAEMERVCKPGGIIIIHLQLWTFGDNYTETVIYNSKSVVDMFKTIIVKDDKQISNAHDSMDWELVLDKL